MAKKQKLTRLVFLTSIQFCANVLCVCLREAFRAVASSSGSDHDAHDAARFRLAWALAHSKRAGDAARAVILLQEGSHRWGETVLARDRHYIVAVAHFNDGDYLAARTAADEALREDAACRQAETLKAAVRSPCAFVTAVFCIPCVALPPPFLFRHII